MLAVSQWFGVKGFNKCIKKVHLCNAGSEMLSAAPDNVTHKQQTGHSEIIRIIMLPSICGNINDLCVICSFVFLAPDFTVQLHVLQWVVPFRTCWFCIPGGLLSIVQGHTLFRGVFPHQVKWKTYLVYLCTHKGASPLKTLVYYTPKA